MLLREPVVAVARAAGIRHIQRINLRTSIGLGKHGVGVPVAAGAGMLFAIGVDAALELRLLIAVAGRALDRRDVIGVRIVPDVGVAVVALEAAMDASGKLRAVDADAVPAVVLHRQVGVTGQAIGLGMKRRGADEDGN